jgi:hypothetical protein
VSGTAGPAGRAGAGARLALRKAGEADVPTLLALIRGIAEYERLSREVEATELGARAMDEWTVFRLTPEAFGRLAREGPPGDPPGETI